MKKSDQTRARIVAAAARLIARKGPFKTKTADLASEAGLSEGAIFRYFPTKAHVFEAVIHRFLGQFSSELQGVLAADSGLSERELLARIIDFHFAFFSGEENLAPIVLGLTEQEGLDSRILTLIRDGLLPYVTRIAHLIGCGIKKGVFRRGDPDLMATALLGLMQATIFRKLLAGAAYSFAEAGDEVKRIFFTGIEIGQRGDPSCAAAGC